MKELVKAFLDRASYGLSAYALSDEEWQAIDDLVAALKARFFLLLAMYALTTCLDFERRHRVFFIQLS